MCGGGERVTSAGLELRVKDAFEEGIWVPSAGLSDVPRIITGPTYLSMGTDSQTSVQKVFFSPPYQCTSPFPHFACRPHKAAWYGLYPGSLALWFLIAFGLE